MSNTAAALKPTEKMGQQALYSVAPESILERQERFYNMPTSSSSDLVMKVLGAGSSIAELPLQAKRVNHSQNIVVRESNNKRQIIVKTDRAETTIEVSDIEKLIGSNKAAKKMFAFALIKINEQAYDYKRGELYHDEIGFPLQELVDMGYYSSIRAARRGFLQAMDILTSLKIKAKVRKGKSNLVTAPEDTEGEGILVMFTGAAVDKSYCKVMLNYKVNWQPLFQYFTIMPKFAFQLGNRAFDLLYSIMYLARQNNQQIKERGYFTIGFRSLQQRLELPNENDTMEHTRLIRQPIEDAVSAIEEQLKATGQDKEFIIEPVYNANSNIRDYLDNGYLKISLHGLYSQPFIDGSIKQQRVIELKAKQKEARIEKAIAAKIAKKPE